MTSWWWQWWYYHHWQNGKDVDIRNDAKEEKNVYDEEEEEDADGDLAVMVLNRSCPAVSQIWSFTASNATIIINIIFIIICIIFIIITIIKTYFVVKDQCLYFEVHSCNIDFEYEILDGDEWNKSYGEDEWRKHGRWPMVEM